MIKVYLFDKFAFVVSIKEAEYMIKNNIIVYLNKKYMVNKNGALGFICSNNITDAKKYKYLKYLASRMFICEDCGQKHAYCIRPILNKNKKIDFKGIRCVCKSCREKFFKKNNISKRPIYKEEFDIKKINKKIDKEIEEKGIINKEDYRNIRINIEFLERFTRLILPIIPEKIKKREEYLLEEAKELQKKYQGKIDLKDYRCRKKIREFLYKESKGICPVCGQSKEIEDFTIDHIVAKNKGGKDVISNFIGMCSKCNKEKGSKGILYFLSTTTLRKVPYRILKIAYYKQNKSRVYLKKLKRQLSKIK